jgi:O-antigen biosynthesis protein
MGKAVLSKVEIKPLLDDRSSIDSLLLGKKIALIYEPTTTNTAFYLKKALERLCSVTLFNPHELDDIPNNFSLYIVVDDSSHYIFPDHLRPAIFWLIDTHLTLSFDWIMALNFDVIFCAQRDGVFHLKKLGFENVYWLPLACDPEVHGGAPLAKIYDIGFVGKLGFGERKKTLLNLKKLFPRSYISTADYKEMAKIYAHSKLIFNMSIRHDLNMRVFEGMCSGSALLADRVDGLDELFEENKHFWGYNVSDEIPNKIHCLLSDLNRSHEVGQAASALVRECHTYDHRARAMLKKTFTSLSQSSPAHIRILQLLSHSPALQHLLLNKFINLLLLSWIDWGMAMPRITNKLKALTGRSLYDD